MLRPWARRPGAAAVYLFMICTIELAMGLIGPAYAVYYVRSAGLNPLQLVLVGTALESSYFLCEVPTGVLADTVSRRLSIIVGLTLIGVAWGLQGAIPLFAAIVLAEIVRGIGEAFASGATEAWIAGEIGEQQVGRLMLRGAQVGQLAYLAGMGASVLLAGIGLNLPIVVSGVLYAALAGVLLPLMPERGFRPLARSERTPWRAAGRTLREGARLVRGSPLLVTILMISAVFGMSSEGIDRLWQAHLLKDFTLPGVDRLPPVAWFSIIAVVSMLLSIPATGIVRRRLDTTRARPVTRALWVFSALRMAAIVVFALTGSAAVALLALWTSGVLRRLIGPIYTAWLTQNAPAEARATIISMSGQADALGQIAGGPVIGVVGTAISLRAAIAAAGAALSPVLVLFPRAGRHGDRNAHAEGEPASGTTGG